MPMCRISLTSLAALSIGVFFTINLAFSSCGTEVVIVRGRVEHSPPGAVVRVELVFPKQQHGESGDVTVEDGKFTIEIPFLMQSHAPVLMGTLREKCDRKPASVIVQLMNSDKSQDFNRVSLDFKKDFKMADASAFEPRSEIVLSDIH
jgi:hypothetical protein